jgi:hypothetical protein
MHYGGWMEKFERRNIMVLSFMTLANLAAHEAKNRARELDSNGQLDNLPELRKQARRRMQGAEALLGWAKGKVDLCGAAGTQASQTQRG